MYGRAGDLAKLNADRNDPTLPDFVRLQADKAHKKIVEQMKDKKLMDMRSQLIKAAQANDDKELVKIQHRMRAYTGEDRETGI